MKNIFTLILIFLTSCSSINNDIFSVSDDLDDFSREWYSKHLRAARENKIILPTEADVYRFTWLRSFHEPVIIKVTCYEKCKLRARVLSGQGGYDPGKIVKSIDIILSAEERNNFEIYFQKLDFWNGQPNSDIVMLDGAQWVLEAAKNNQYRIWNVAGPHNEKQFLSYIDFCVFLLDLAGIIVPTEEFY